MSGKVVFITGISSGFGEVTALYLIEKGFRVYGISRSALKSQALIDGVTGHYRADVTDEQAVRDAVARVVEKEGRIDVVVNNAGMGIGGALEETTAEQLQKIFDVNFFGVARVCNAVLPYMRKQGEGLIINISSVGGLIGIPFQGAYSATKFAIEGYSESLHKEVAPFGVEICIVEPGDFHTGFTKNRVAAAQFNTESPYYETYKRALERIESDEINGSDPSLFAEKIYEIIVSEDRAMRNIVGEESLNELLAAKKTIPDKVFSNMIAQHYMSEETDA